MVLIEQNDIQTKERCIQQLAQPINIQSAVNPLNPNYPNFRYLPGLVVFPNATEGKITLAAKPGAVVLRKEFYKETDGNGGKVRALHMVQMLVVRKCEGATVQLAQVTLDYEKGTVRGNEIVPRIIERQFIEQLPQNIELRLEGEKTKTNMSFLAEHRLNPRIYARGVGYILELEIPKSH